MFGNPSRPPIGPFRRASPSVQACPQVCLYSSGLPPCISAMMLVALQNNSLGLIFSVVWTPLYYLLSFVNNECTAYFNYSAQNKWSDLPLLQTS